MASVATKVSKNSRHKYQQSWEKDYFVTEFGDACTCLICGHVFTSNRKFNVQRHFNRYHIEYNESFPKMTAARKKQIKTLKSKPPTETPSTESTELINHRSHATTMLSFKIAFLLAKALKPFEDGAIAKQLISSAAQELLSDGEFKDNFLAKIDDVPLSRNTIARRVKEISADINEQLIEDLQKCRLLSLQLAEPNDVSDAVQLCVFIRMAFDDCTVTEEFLSIVRLKGRTRNEDIFTALKNRLTESGVPLKKIVSVTTDGAPAMIADESGILGSCRRDPDFPAFTAFRCIVHQLSLCFKSLDMAHVIEPVTKIVNSIRAKALQDKLFPSLFEESNCDDPLPQAEVAGLSGGGILKRFYEVLPDIKEFLRSKNESYHQLENQAWLRELAFFADLTRLMDELNLQIQGENILIWRFVSKINCFHDKLCMWIDFFLLNDVPAVFEKLKKISLEFSDFYSERFATYLLTISEAFKRHFQDFGDIGIIAKYFNAPYSAVDSAEVASTIVKLFPDVDNSTIRSEMIELRHDDKQRFLESMHGSNVEYFWQNIDRLKYENLVSVFIRLLSCSGSSYLCAKMFLTIKNVKSKSRSRLTDENLDSLLRISVSKYHPDFKKLSESTNSQVSH